MRIINKRFFICALASILFVVLSVSPLLVRAYDGSLDYCITYNYLGVKCKDTFFINSPFDDSKIECFISSENKPIVYFIGTVPFTCTVTVKNISSKTTDITVEDNGTYYYASYPYDMNISDFSGFILDGSISSVSDAIASYDALHTTVEPTEEPSTEEPSMEEPTTPDTPVIEGDYPIDTYLSLFISQGLWYGMEIATLMSFVGYGVFKALSLLNINKK